jgi:hypothetical protein
MQPRPNSETGKEKFPIWVGYLGRYDLVRMLSLDHHLWR